MDEYPDSAIPEAEAIKTVENANQAVVGIYSAFKSSSLYSGYLTLLPDIQTDLVYAVNGYSNTYGNIWRWDILSTNTEIEATYGALYDIISRSNFLLDNIDNVRKSTTDDEALEKTEAYEGEARMARAMAYSELIKLFCKAYESDEQARKELGVAIVEHYNTDGYTPVRSSLYDSYQFVIADLEMAEKLLAVDDAENLTLYSNWYFSEYVVAALRARIALYMKDWTAAVKYSSKVIDSGYYALSSASTYYNSTYTYF